MFFQDSEVEVGPLKCMMRDTENGIGILHSHEVYASRAKEPKGQ